jgi:AraC family transcriptional regulator, regulatory protein of adaptative response / methylated-DNA-[protein]-cysteine methyltransferase
MGTIGRRGTVRTQAERITAATAASALGTALVAKSPRGICAVLLGDDPAALLRDVIRRFPGAAVRATDDVPDSDIERVFAAVASPGTDVDVPLDLHGTVFQQAVWAALREIPPGTTASYRELAERIGRPTAVRAVAAACAANPVAVLVPCHRVLRSDGGLSGYHWGVERKRALLDRERETATASAAAPAATPVAAHAAPHTAASASTRSRAAG